MSPRWNWDSPTPLAASECAIPPGPKGGGAHSPAGKGFGESQFQRLEKRLALCLLCADNYLKLPATFVPYNLPSIKIDPGRRYRVLGCTSQLLLINLQNYNL
jgi:hypothetical protein